MISFGDLQNKIQPLIHQKHSHMAKIKFSATNGQMVAFSYYLSTPASYPRDTSQPSNRIIRFINQIKSNLPKNLSTFKFEMSMKVFLASTTNSNLSPENVLGTESSPNMSWSISIRHSLQWILSTQKQVMVFILRVYRMTSFVLCDFE